MVFTTLKEHSDYLTKLASAKPDAVSIASFNLYAGIMHDGTDLHTKVGREYKSSAHEFLDALVSCSSVRILVGVPAYDECVENCKNCAENYIKRLMRLNAHAERWPFKWRFAEDFHLKSYVFEWNGKLKRAVIGGRNLSGSSYVDLSMPIQDDSVIDKVSLLFDEWWKKSTSITQSNLDDMVIRHGIDKRFY
jgi:hypothetical protein